MPHWMALLPGTLPPADVDADAGQADGIPPCLAVLDAPHLAWWSLQFTPRVALLEEAVVLEIQSSERLFGGRRALRGRITREARALGIGAWAHAGTALAALASARQARRLALPTLEGGEAIKPPHLAARLDALPLETLPGVAEHQPTLARLGCATLGDVRRLPRGGLSRRFGASLLHALDQAYGARTESFEWTSLPPVFDARQELPGRVEDASALLFAAQRLLQQLGAWLAGRQAGVTAFTLRWRHDWHRRDQDGEGQRTIRMASPTRDVERLSRLLAEHLQHIRLASPVGDIGLHADQIEALPLDSLALFQEHGDTRTATGPDALLTPSAQRAQRDALLALLDRLSVRLGAGRVRQARIQADHRIECSQVWHPVTQAPPPASPRPPQDRTPLIADMPQPCWILAEPLPLMLAGDGAGPREHPVYKGRLALLAGPHRIEAGWWDAASAMVTRDYYLASSDQAGLLWIFRSRHPPDGGRSPWFLHGFFA